MSKNDFKPFFATLSLFLKVSRAIIFSMFRLENSDPHYSPSATLNPPPFTT